MECSAFEEVLLVKGRQLVRKDSMDEIKEVCLYYVFSIYVLKQCVMFLSI